MAWKTAMLAHLILSIAYLGISWALARPLIKTRQIRSNPLGTATVIIFLSCALSHGGHSVHLLGPMFGFEADHGLALRAAFTWHQVIIDVLAAGIGVYYWSLRHSYGPLLHGAAMFEDLVERQRQALEINDNIVQGLTVAQMALAVNDTKLSQDALRSTLEKAREIVSGLLGDVDGKGRVLKEGDLVRSQPAVVSATTPPPG